MPRLIIVNWKWSIAKKEHSKIPRLFFDLKEEKYDDEKLKDLFEQFKKDIMDRRYDKVSGSENDFILPIATNLMHVPKKSEWKHEILSFLFDHFSKKKGQTLFLFHKAKVFLDTDLHLLMKGFSNDSVAYHSFAGGTDPIYGKDGLISDNNLSYYEGIEHPPIHTLIDEENEIYEVEKQNFENVWNYYWGLSTKKKLKHLRYIFLNALYLPGPDGYERAYLRDFLEKAGFEEFVKHFPKSNLKIEPKYRFEVKDFLPYKNIIDGDLKVELSKFLKDQDYSKKKIMDNLNVLAN